MSENQQLPALLKQMPDRGWVEGLEFSYWDRGGPPGNGYESNLLEITGEGSQVRLRYTKTRFDETKPPYRVERFQLTGQNPRALTSVGKKLVEMFSGEFAEEHPLPIGDVTKLTFSIGDGRHSLSKTFYREMPRELRSLQQDLEGMMQRCEKDGTSMVETAPSDS